MITKRTIEVELKFNGDGRIVQKHRGHFFGGVPEPKLGKNISFTIHRQIPDEDGILNPVFGEETVKGSFQINVYGNSKGYRELGKYLLALAELDAREDESFHQHHDDLMSADDRTHLHIILRKKDKAHRKGLLKTSRHQ